jgi:nicotinic acetylcholine receptor beta-4
MKKILLLLFFSSIIYINNGQYDYEEEDPTNAYKIYDDIMSGKSAYNNDFSNVFTLHRYNRKMRPTGSITKTNNTDKNGSLKIIVKLSLKQIISLDEKNQILTTSFDLHLSWTDHRLTWEPVLYNNITAITVPATDFWLPDIAIMNSVSLTNLLKYDSNQNMLITFFGSVFLNIGMPSQQTRCKLDVYKYPFDTQSCSILIGSWQNSMKEFKFYEHEHQVYDLDDFVSNSIWRIWVKSSKSINTNRFKLANHFSKLNNASLFSASDINFNLILKRNPLHIMINGIFPCFVLNCVILIAFGVPFVQQINLCKLNKFHLICRVFFFRIG